MPDNDQHKTTSSGFTMYTDGSFRKPNFGAWGYILHNHEGEEIHRCGKPVWDTTISRMELMAMISGIEKIIDLSDDEKPKVTIYSDSQYAIKSVLWWIPVWKENGWKNSLGEDVKNRDLMEKLASIREQVKLTAWHVKAHSGHKYNEQVDEIVQDITRKMKAKKLKP